MDVIKHYHRLFLPHQISIERDYQKEKRTLSSILLLFFLHAAVLHRKKLIEKCFVTTFAVYCCPFRGEEIFHCYSTTSSHSITIIAKNGSQLLSIDIYTKQVKRMRVKSTIKSVNYNKWKIFLQ